MRISDWSSDVCSSDLNPFLAAPIEASAELLGLPPAVRMRMVQNADDNLESIEVHACDRDYDAADGAGECWPETAGDEIGAVTFAGRNFTAAERPAGLDPASRSEEPTSERQSLMSIHSAVFFLKKKNIAKK